MDDPLDLPNVHVVGFAGRPCVGNPSAMEEALRHELQKLQVPGTHLLAISPLSQPADLIFGRAATDLGIHLIILLPAPADQLAARFPGNPGIEFSRLLQKAARVEVLSPTPLGTASHLGERLVDKVDVLLAVSDGAENPEEGDVAEVIAYAENRGRTVISLREKSEKIEVSEWKPGDDSAQPVAGVELLQKKLGDLPPQADIPPKLIAYFEECDTRATKTAPQVRRYVVNIVLANAVASMAGAVGTSFPHSPGVGTYLTALKFSCVLIGLTIFGLLRHRQSQNRWLAFRLKAEVCRSAIATWYAREAIDPLSVDETPELHELIRALHFFRATEHKNAEISLEAFKADYGVRRLADQYFYFQKQARKATEISGKLTPIYWTLSAAALLASAASLIFQSIYQRHDALGQWTNFVFAFVPIVAPALASWILAWEAIEAVSRKKSRFAEMARLMHAALVDLVHSHSWEAVDDLVKRTEKLLLQEVLEWYSFVKYSK